MKVSSEQNGLVVEAESYRLRVAPGAWFAALEDSVGRSWADLCLVAAVDAMDGPDETDSLDGPLVEDLDEVVRLTWRLGSSRWTAKRLVLDCADDGVTIRAEVEGAARVMDVSLLGGHVVLPSGAAGSISSRPYFATLFSPAPSDPGAVVLPARVSTDISAAGGAEPGRGQWFFTPAPFCYAVSRTVATDPLVPPDDEWLTFAAIAAPDEQRFVGFGYRGRDEGFRFVLDYEGHTEVRGTWSSPSIVVSAAADPYDGIRRYRRRVLGATAAADSAPAARPSATPKPTPDWWLEPMFCGWGAQCALAADGGMPMSAAKQFARQPEYDGFLAALEDHDIVPGTIVIDDKWQLAYATGEPDRAKWPDLRGWIADRHERGQRVIVWWKAWDVEGLPPELTVRTADGRPIAIDPGRADARDALAAAVTRVVGPDGLAADGLKLDFTARTPSGASLVASDAAWGVGLLRALLETIREAAKSANPDSLLIGQVVEPSLAHLIDMVRLNDMLRLDDPEQPASVVPQMRYRAAVVRAACPDHPVDTDDWCALDLADWRRYTEIKPELGIPALYYATGLDRTRERFTADDYTLIRDTWRSYRQRVGLAEHFGARGG
ncbi:MAG: hypothetical protein ACJ779_02190 [Chloroflexota bacterium]